MLTADELATERRLAAGRSVVQKPSVVGSDFRRFANLTWTLAITDYKLRFYGSILGYVWTLVRPFLLFGVILFVFTQVIQLNKDVPFYSVYILMAMVLFQYFSEATGNSVQSLVTREGLLRKMRFPRLVIPAAVVLTSLFNLIGTLGAVAIFALALGVDPRWTWLELPVLIAALTFFAFGLAMLLSALYVRFRDLLPIWEVFSQALFYATPILYVSETVPNEYERYLLISPLASLLVQMRHAVIDPNAPTAAEAIGGNARLLIPIGLGLVVVVVGALVFSREAPRVAENL